MATAKAQPASPAAVRCMRLRAAPGADASRVFIAAVFLAPTLWLIAFVSIAASTGRPGSPMLTRILELANLLSARLFTLDKIVLFGMVALMLWLAPAITRYSVDFRLRSWTQAVQISDRKIRRRSKPIFIAVFTLILLAPLVIMLFGDGPVPGALLGSFIYLKVSLLLGIFALFDRRGKHLTCAKCGYAMSSWRSAKPTCPECTNRWKDAWKARIGSQAINQPLAAFSIALFITSGIMLVIALTKALNA